MKLKTAISDAAVMLGLDDAVAALEGEEGGEETNAEISRLVRCANLVIAELAADVVPLKTKERLELNPSLDYSKFAKTPLDVYSVTAKNGGKVRFREYYDRLEVDENGVYDVEYSYMPSFVGKEDEIPFPALPPFVLAQGTAREYCVISGMTSEADVWDQRFNASVNARVRPKKEARVRRRAWA